MRLRRVVISGCNQRASVSADARLVFRKRRPLGALRLGLTGEQILSKTYGDTARFNRLRKQRIRLRERVREMRVALEAQKAATPPEGSNRKA